MLRYLCLLGAASTVLAAAPPSLEQLLGVPFPSGLVSNDHGRIAWIENVKGVRNIWAAESPAFRPHRVTNYSEDDGMELSNLSLSADGAYVVFTRGEGVNSAGEFPNPNHLIAGVDQTIEVAPFAGPAPRTAGRGHSPAISPDSRTIAFVWSGQIWTVPLDGSAAAAAVTHNRGHAADLVWSPDGHRLAFTSNRERHSLIAVYTVGANALRFLDPGSDFDSNPEWSRDGSRVAFIRVPSTFDWEMHEPRRAAQTPWSIRVASFVTGAGRQIWQAQPGAGSVFRATASNRQLFWTARDSVVFPWERTGWLQLYSVPSSGGAATALWPGQGDSEVEDVTLAPDRGELLCSSNHSDIEKRHIWRLSLSGDRAPVSVGQHWIESTPVYAGPGAIAFVRSDAQPARVALVREASPKVDDLTDSHLDSAPETPSPVTFTAADGLTIHAQLFLPLDHAARHPAVIFIHGGSRRQMLPGWNPMFYYYQAYAFNQYLASRGFVVLSVNYRSGTGYGLDFREALDYGPSGGSEYNDILAAGLYLRARADVVPDRIGLWGGSYGGYLTAMGLARDSSLFAAGVDLHGVHDWNGEMEDGFPIDQPDQRRALAATALSSSPLAYVSGWRSPVLLIQGDDDRNVNFQQTEILVEALRKQGVPFEELIFPDEIHDFLTYEHWLRAYQASASFLDRHLRPAMTK